MTREEALKLRRVIEQAAQSLDDATASTTPTLFPALKQDGQLVKVGTRINWKGVVKRAAVDLWDTIDNDPDHAPTRWEDLTYRKGVRIIPEVITVGMAFAEGEKGWWGEKLYISLVNDNVFTPDQFPNNWEEVTNEVEAEQRP